MKPRRVYPLSVELPRGVADKGSASVASLVVKPVIAGAVVTPAEQMLDLTPSGGSVTFGVAPLAKGRLPDARVDVLQQGRLVERVRMSMRGRTQFATWVLLLLTLIMPWIVLNYTSIAPLSGDVPRMVPKVEGAPNADDGPKPPPPPQRPGGPPGQGEAPPAAPEQPQGSQIKRMVGDSGEVLQFKISHTVRANSPKIPWVIEDKPDVLSKNPEDGLEWAAWGLGEAYQFLCVGANNLHPAFWCGTALLVLTLLSLLFHRTVRATIRKKGIRLVDPALAGLARSAAHEEPATIVEVVD
jgi:hypothetical protein